LEADFCRESVTPPAMSELPFSVTGIDRSDYMVNDMLRAIAFYRDVLGLEPLEGAGEEGAEFELPDGAIFGLWNGKDNVPFQPGNGVMFGVTDFEAAVASVEARGIPIVSNFETPQCFIATFHDSEGNIVNVHKRKTP
jgi:predicted enzyme related to lactoylglutathione lyase